MPFSTIEFLHFENELLKTGEIKTVIDKKYSLSQMADAHSYVEKGHKKGNVVIEINSNYQL